MTDANNKLDMRGRPCPEPVIETRRVLETTDVSSLVVLVDNEASSENVARAGRDLGCEVSVEKTPQGVFRLNLIRTDSAADPMKSAAAASPCGTPENLVVLIPTDRFGEGDPELGHALIQAFIGTLGSISPRPKTLIFLNAGAKLVCEESPIIQSVKALVETGCNVLVCGTCLDFYGLDQRLRVGSVSNMFEIASALAAADKIIRP